MISSIVGVLLFNCLFAEPWFTLFVYDTQYVITTIVMLAASLFTHYIMTLFREQLDREMLETNRLDVLLDTSQQLQQVNNEDDIFQVALNQLYRMFNQTILQYPISDNRWLSPMIKSAATYAGSSSEKWVMNEEEQKRFFHMDTTLENPFIGLRNGEKAVYYQVNVSRRIFAVAAIILDSKHLIDNFEHTLILAILNEVALSLEKHKLHEINEQIARDSETERLRKSILRTISHDLLTPLTNISGNADMLLNIGGQIVPEQLKSLYQSIYDDSEDLINLVENLLFISRIDNGVMPIHMESEALQEILPEVINSLTKRAKDRTIRLEMPDELLIVNIEARLIMQIIHNIIDNAIKNSPAASGITVRVFRRGAYAVIEVTDEGCGINDEEKQKVFELFYTSNNKSGDSRRGIRLGLSLCQSIVSAHGGLIYIEDNIPSDAVVSFTLPLEDPSDGYKSVSR